ncbi:MAG: FKBP-type peptidyl-prolyl cis-trans isomerase [Porticoccaceae bacterium]|nr:FKBP-type peptidyl-prolyl cis-trans isomerase [Porticoccaceae bacterium]
MNLKKINVLPVALVASLTLMGCEEATKPKTDTSVAAAVALESEMQKVSYIMGTNIGSQIKGEAFDVDIPSLTLGLNDAVEGNKPKLSETEINAVIEAFQAKVMAEQEASAKLVAETNIKEGEAFLAENAKKEGVVVLESGLQYKIVEAGTGEVPTAENTVEVHYKGTLLDGTEFDSSFKRGVPAQFGVTQVIPGWVEALQLMKEGAKWELYVPADLAYGPGGTGGLIGPNQTLIFEVELLKASVDTAG